MSALRSTIASVLAGVLVLACASGGGPQSRTKAAPIGPPLASTGDRVGKVVVTAGEGLTAEQKQAVASYKVAESLTSQIVQRAGSGGQVTLNVTITSLRLRSGFSAVAWGLMAGPDLLDVTVSAEKNGKVLRTFDTGSGSGLGGIAFAAPTRRVNRLILSVAERVATSL